jgi:hypothetical protein
MGLYERTPEPPEVHTTELDWPEQACRNSGLAGRRHDRPATTPRSGQPVTPTAAIAPNRSIAVLTPSALEILC